MSGALTWRSVVLPNVNISEVILATLLSSFRFVPDKDVVWNLASVSYPTVAGTVNNKPSMPLRLEPLAT